MRSSTRGTRSSQLRAVDGCGAFVPLRFAIQIPWRCPLALEAYRLRSLALRSCHLLTPLLHRYPWISNDQEASTTHSASITSTRYHVQSTFTCKSQNRSSLFFSRDRAASPHCAVRRHEPAELEHPWRELAPLPSRKAAFCSRRKSVPQALASGRHKSHGGLRDHAASNTRRSIRP